MFVMNELEPYFEMAATLEINGMTFTLTKIEEMSGVHAVWVSDSYKVYATPYFEGIPIPVEVIDCNGQPIGTDGYPVEVDSFDRYVKVVKTLTDEILRRPQM
jgi:hypothetical protein